MTRRLFERLLLRPRDLPASREDFEVIGAFNPGAVRLGDEVILLVRVAERPREQRPGWTPLPRWDAEQGLTIDWLPDEDIEPLDPRVVRLKLNGQVRLTFLSHLRVVRCGDGRRVESIGNTCFGPESECEEFGIEDPRITMIGDRIYFTYVAVSRHGAATAFASTRDFKTFERHGIIFCPENKDVVLFPEAIGGEYAALHRPNGATPFTIPEMWLARSPDLRHWGVHDPLEQGSAEWETGRCGAGTPPVKTAAGWLEIYHGNRRPRRPGEVGVYSAGAMLLDLENPAHVLRRSREPILVPTADFEQQGFVGGVVFPTGLIETGETLLMYYGASDSFTAVVELDRSEVMKTLS